MGWFYFFFVCSVCIPNLLKEAYADLPDVDNGALLALKAAFNPTTDLLGCLESWNPTKNQYCLWDGVICKEGSTRVSRIILPGCNMVGFLAPELGKLEMLTDLTLYSNALQGSIPPELGNLTNLIYLQLSNNSLQGSIPEKLGDLTKLQYLELQENNLNGTVPAELAYNFRTMSRVDLTNNKGLGGLGGLTGPCTENACCPVPQDPSVEC